MSLQFTNFNGTPYFTHTEVMDMIAILEAGNGFWDRTSAELNAMADEIEERAELNWFLNYSKSNLLVV